MVFYRYIGTFNLLAHHIYENNRLKDARRTDQRPTDKNDPFRHLRHLADHRK